MGEQVGARKIPYVDLNISMDIKRLQNEFGQALRFYQNCMQKLKLDPENEELRQNVAKSQQQIVAVNLKQKLFVKQFREKSHMAPGSALSENKASTAPTTTAKVGGGSNETADGGCSSSNHYTPPNSEDEHSDASRSLSTGSGVSICADSISSPSSVSSTPLSSRPNSPSSLVHPKVNQPVFPSDVMEQEEFLKGFGLITHESLKSQSETKRVERRRRTTANPKYNTNGFVDLSQISRRTRRMEESEEGGSSPKRMTLMASVKSKHSQPKCIVCEQIGCNLTCECCQAQLHVDCIRVSGSKAPAPTRLHQCPRCIVAMNESERFNDSSSNEDYLKFQKPLIPSTPIIPANLKKKSLGSLPPDLDQNSFSPDVKTTHSTKTKLAKKVTSVQAKSVAVKPKPGGNSNKATATISTTTTITPTTTTTATPTTTASATKKAGLKVTSVSNSSTTNNNRPSSKVDHLGKPIFASPFKSLSALTSKGVGTNGMKNLEDTSLSECNGGVGATGISGNQSVIPCVKKKSKLNGVKAKTLSVTGGSGSSNNSGSKAAVKPKTSPLNNVNCNGNVGNGKAKASSSVKAAVRLPKFSSDQHLSMQRTILAMTAAAKSVMSSNGMKVLPVSLSVDLQISHDHDQAPKTVSVGTNNAPNVPSSGVPNSAVSTVPPVPPVPSCPPRVLSSIINPEASPTTPVSNLCVGGFKCNSGELLTEKQ